MRKKTLVISGVNLVEGGTLAVMRACVQAARDALGPEWRILALVHQATLFRTTGVEYLPFAQIKSSWWRRIWFEYFSCKKISRAINPDIWLAMHDMTPRVRSRRQAVYCHNAMPFYRMTWREIRLAPKLWAFSLFYGALYRFRLRCNDAVFVQQAWIRDAFTERFDARNVVVARPEADAVTCPSDSLSGVAQPRPPSPPRCFFYPALPRPFKNFDVLGEALEKLESDERWQGEIRITLRGDENAYAASVRQRFGHLRTLKFIGLQDAKGMAEHYRTCDALIFPSALETWGLPLTEAKSWRLPILAADLPYAHETVGDYDRTAFFEARNASDLANKLLRLHLGQGDFQPHPALPIRPPQVNGWPALIEFLVRDL